MRNSDNFSRKTQRKARKEYTCWICHLKIRIDEIHYEVVGKHEWQFYNVRECLNHK